MLIIRDFSKSFSDQLIISIPHLDLNTGIYWIKGENGSGKTTLFKCLTGLLPCKGTIAFSDGVSLRQSPVSFRKRINYSEAEPVYPGFLTAKDLIRFIGKTRESSLEQQQTLMEMFGINKFFEKPCSTYSSGMLKKLSLAAAFLGSPQIIILDEPLITLDEHARKILLSLIESYTRQQETTFLLSSHQAMNAASIKITQAFSITDKKLVVAIDL